MRPGQTTPNEFERAILARLANEQPSLRPFPDRLHVLSRKYTGVGSFTQFLCREDGPKADQQFCLNSRIRMPGVPNGLGAVLDCKGDEPIILEIFTYGDERWDGVHEGFVLDPDC